MKEDKGKERNEKEKQAEREEDVEKLRSELEAKKKEYDELLERSRRIMAEYVNYRSRVEREKEDIVFSAQKKILQAFLPVIDDFYRAIRAAQTCEDVNSLKEGLLVSEQQFKKLLESIGVKEVECVNLPFDPRYQDATDVTESEEVDFEKVAEVCEKGYIFKSGGREEVLRAAKVKVVKPKQKT
ncbi:MAG: nucleotide exchange factor GrpE [Planctomycetota bacterium]|nr:nucleotide exchange factor GrpE [Planctomycetota bacterium]